MTSAPTTLNTAKVVTGTPGNDMLTIPAGTQLVEGDGGIDTVLLGAYQYYANYQIVQSGNGTIIVTDAHGGSLVGTEMVGIASLQFTDGSYTVATGKFTTGSAAAIVAPAAPQPVSAAVIPSPHEVVFSPGHDTLAIPAGTLLVEGDGGTDIAVLADYQYYANYQILRAANGTITVTDEHGGSLIGTSMAGVTTLQFADGSYSVATGQFTAGSGSAVPTAGTPGAIPFVVATTGLLTAPTVSAPQHSGDVVAVLVANGGVAALPSRDITFGQSFADGDVPAGASLVATINGQQVALQMDVKNTNADGSVMDAIITLAAPSLAAQSAFTVMLSRATTAVSAGAAINPSGMVAAGYNEQLTLTLHNADGSTGVTTLNVGAALTQALAAGTAQSWLNGALASEEQFSVAINPALTAQFNIREYADGSFVTTAQILNNGIFASASKTYNYDITLASHGQTQFSQTNVVEAPMQDWTQSVWSNAQGQSHAPADQLIYNVAYLEKSGVVDAYATGAGVNATTLAAQQTALAAANTGPLGAALVTQYEPTTGARPDIGPTTQWGADWLVSQSAVAEQIMLANANAAGAEPIYAVNANGSAVSTANDPGFWLDSRNSTNLPTVNYGTVETISNWTMDAAHIADLTYLAALSTGSAVLLEQLQAQANFDLLSVAPPYRANDSAMLGLQERGIAWTIRDVANAAFLTPGSSPLKAYFTQQVDAVIQNLDSNYVHGALGAEEGQLQGYIMGAFDTNQVAPWEQGYIVIALGQAAAQGFAGATEVLGWMNNFISGLYLNGANGYNPLEGSGYWLTTGSGSLATSNYQSFTSWQQLFSANFAGQASPSTLNGFPNDPVGGFSTIAKAALAVEWNVTHATQDLAAYAYITQQTGYLIQNTGGYDSAQTWDIVPTLADGHQLQNSEVTYGTGGSFTSASPHGLLAAASGNNILQAGSGDSILIGGSGNDQLKGGAGNDFLFAGTGTQSLYGGGGNNTLEGHLNGGSGVNSFLFKVSDIAQDTLLNFKPGVDMLDISGAAPGVTLASLLATVTSNAAGDALLHLSPQHEVILTGIHPAQLTLASLALI